MKIVTKDNASEIVSRLRNAADAYVLPSYLEDSNTIRPEDFNALKEAILADRRIVFQFDNQISSTDFAHMNSDVMTSVAWFADGTGVISLVFHDRNGSEAINEWAMDSTGAIQKTRYRVATSDDLDRKVDKVTGKGLSTNDFTNAYKAKLDRLGDSQILPLSNLPPVGYGVTQEALDAIGLTSTVILNILKGDVYNKVSMMDQENRLEYMCNYSSIMSGTGQRVITIFCGDMVHNFGYQITSNSNGTYGIEMHNK